MDQSQVSYAIARQARINKEESDKRDAATAQAGRDLDAERKPERGSQQLGEGSRK
jgi:hypothetical protein